MPFLSGIEPPHATLRGSQIVLEERLKSPGPLGLVSRLVDPLIHIRNVGSLIRLRRLVEAVPSRVSGATI